MAHVREQPEGDVVRLSDFSGELQLRDTSGSVASVARMIPANPPFWIQSYKHSNTQAVIMEADLDRYRLEAIEKARRGRDLHLAIQLRAQAEQKGQRQAVGGSEEVNLNRGQWIDILKQLGYRETLLLEIPLSGAKNRHLASAIKHLDTAHDALQRGAYRDAVAMCRDALEALTPFAGDDREATFENSRHHNKNQRLLVLRRALRQLPHAAKHAEPGDQLIEWEHADAEMLVSMTAALVRRYVPA
jgi:hypothetical protein